MAYSSKYPPSAFEIKHYRNPLAILERINAIEGLPDNQTVRKILGIFDLLLTHQEGMVGSEWDNVIAELYRKIVNFRNPKQIFAHMDEEQQDYVFERLVNYHLVPNIKIRFYFMTMTSFLPLNYFNQYRARDVVGSIVSMQDDLDFENDLTAKHNRIGVRLWRLIAILLREDFGPLIRDFFRQVHQQISAVSPHDDLRLFFKLIQIPEAILKWVYERMDDGHTIHSKEYFDVIMKYYKFLSTEEAMILSQLPGISDMIAKSIIEITNVFINLNPLLDHPDCRSDYKDGLRYLEMFYSRQMEIFQHNKLHSVIKSLMINHPDDMKEIRKRMTETRLHLHFYIPSIRKFSYNIPPQSYVDPVTEKLMLVPVICNNGITMDKSTYFDLKMNNKLDPCTNQVPYDYTPDDSLQDEIQEWLACNDTTNAMPDSYY